MLPAGDLNNTQPITSSLSACRTSFSPAFLTWAWIKASDCHWVTCSWCSCWELLVGTHRPEHDLSFSFHPLIMPMRLIHVSERPLTRRLVMCSYCCIRSLPIRQRFKKRWERVRHEACSRGQEKKIKGNGEISISELINRMIRSFQFVKSHTHIDKWKKPGINK